jgi:hypothetical protein
VAISVADYQSLRAKAYPTEPSPVNAGISATLTRIDYDLHAEGDLVKGQANLTVDVLKDGWVRIPIPPKLVVWEAKLDGKRVSLVSDEHSYNNYRAAVFFHQGRAILTLDIVVPIETTPAVDSIELPQAIAGITRASIQLPRREIETKLSGGIFVSEPEGSAPGDGGRWVAYGYGNAPLILSWAKKVEEPRNEQPLRMRGSLTELVGLGEDSTSIQAEVSAEIVQGSAREIKIRVPDKVAVNHVTGSMIADWETKSGELIVTFLEPVEKSAAFVIYGETRTPRDGPIDIPLLRLLNVERENGGAAIEVLGAGEIKAKKSAGLDNADPSDLGGIVSNRQSPSLAAFRFQPGDDKTKRSISVDIARYIQEAVLMANIEEARYQVLMSAEGKHLVQARYAIRNNQRNFLKITLPPDATLWSAALSGNPIRPGQSSDGSLLLPLQKVRAGEDAPPFEAEILYFSRGEKWSETGKLKIALPEVDLPISRTGVNYFYPPLYKVTPEPGSFRVQDYQEPVSAVLRKPVFSGIGAGSGIGSNGLGSFLGAIKDPRGSAVNGASVTVKNTETGVERRYTTNNIGGFYAQGLQPGYYEIRVEKEGFASSLLSNVRLENGTHKIDLKLEAGKKEDVVEVNIKAENIVLENGASIGSVIPQDQIAKLPLVNSNVLDLAKVMGGFVTTENPIFGVDDSTLAGLSATNAANNTRWVTGMNTPANLTPEMVSEFKVNVAPVDAEMGRGSSQIQPNTKALVDEYRTQSREGKRAGILPIQLSFPAYGPSVFLASELTAENKTAVIGISYEMEKKGGSR